MSSRKEGRKEIQHLRRRMRFLTERIENTGGNAYDITELPALKKAIAYWEACFDIPLAVLSNLIDSAFMYADMPEQDKLNRLGGSALLLTVGICGVCKGPRNGHRSGCREAIERH